MNETMTEHVESNASCDMQNARCDKCGARGGIVLVVYPYPRRPMLACRRCKTRYPLTENIYRIPRSIRGQLIQAWRDGVLRNGIHLV
jgi:uncharacterized protein YbaR (Trm112 family)